MKRTSTLKASLPEHKNQTKKHVKEQKIFFLHKKIPSQFLPYHFLLEVSNQNNLDFSSLLLLSISQIKIFCIYVRVQLKWSIFVIVAVEFFIKQNDKITMKEKALKMKFEAILKKKLQHLQKFYYKSRQTQNLVFASLNLNRFDLKM
ncbi:hypothetical protein TTHERM_000016168 (macronuclear) [Tetrahymena thermophila SB210]|uniref:Uncharacterized protein n=1 Tax=Tetrahymena thermophila (strain SB210) TaxID=312017 RepID=W7XAF4_TETTS|nr:hypothetical protein TTHERM_000016168 [Tetrahymena thermophila SB210]EWS76370.1 hypothetical protein TTHERM_000016168 [Tetrahymena thermophila SB210]|eukprot:XP_012651154.1 hypothetical protein TTHERM_000016168 [Tetrahymena thermophila SB210]